MSSPQSRPSTRQAESPAVEEIRTKLYVDSARLKVVSKETKIHPADARPAAAISASREESS